jgi:hypothetical protein
MLTFVFDTYIHAYRVHSHSPQCNAHVASYIVQLGLLVIMQMQMHLAGRKTRLHKNNAAI